MKKILAYLLIASTPYLVQAQCNTSNATDCECPDGSEECDLLPDITISWECLENGANGPDEEAGRLYVSGSTPNMGSGPLNMRGGDQDGYRWFVCGLDTVSIYDPNSNTDFECPNGAVAEHIVIQRIYHKNGNVMSFTERMVPNAMTYHSNHGHNHFDEWGVFTLRYQDVTMADPRNWPIVGRGHKLGFCLMDYYTCSGAPNDDCRDDNTVYGGGVVMDNSDFPNYELGGGNYGCGQVSQGISVGYTDVYYEHLDGMWIDIPDEVCNGDYWIVYEVDPNDVVLESNEENNYTAIPYTLTEQGNTGNQSAVIQAEGGRFVCEGDSVLLSATAGGTHIWSNGATTSTIYGHPGNSYSVQVGGYCGSATSQTVAIEAVPAPSTPTTEGDDICISDLNNPLPATLTATGNNIVWYDGSGEAVGSGNTFVTPGLTSTTDFYAASVNEIGATTAYGGKIDNSGGGGNLNSNQGLEFETYMPLTIKSVKVYAQGAGPRTFVITDQVEMFIASGTFDLVDGEQRVDLNFEVPESINLTFSSYGDVNLYRNNAGVSYPYTVNDTLSITGSTAGSDYYYWFYDWEIEAGGGECSSEMVTTTATVDICAGIVDDYDMNDRISTYPNPSEGEFTLDIKMPGTADVIATVVDVSGRKVFSETYSDVTGNFVQIIDLPNVSAGIYWMSLDIENRRYFKRISVY